jgi:glycosyltransferase involved in cell wall biosynthesis
VYSLMRFRPRILMVCGYDQPETLAALFYAKITFAKIVLMTDSKFNDTEVFPRSVDLEWIKSWFVGRFDAILCPSEEHAEYLRFLGGTPRNVITGAFDVIDNNAWAASAQSADYDGQVIAALGVEVSEQYFFSPARLLAKKNIATLISAYSTYVARMKLAGDRAIIKLVICGSGREHNSIRQQIVDASLIEHVNIVEWLDREAMPRAMRRARAVILASLHDQWGNVVSESLAAGTPVLVSNHCGAHNLVKGGVNGYTFAPRDAEHLAQLLSLMTQDDTWKKMRENTQASLSEFNDLTLRSRYCEMMTVLGHKEIGLET